MRRLCLGLAVLLAGAAPIATSPVGAAPAAFPGADFTGYSSGAVVHVGVLKDAGDGPRLVDTSVAFSGASVASEGFTGAMRDELKQAVSPKAAPGSRAFGRGVGLQVGTGTPLVSGPDGNEVIGAGATEAAAPPAAPLATTEFGPVQASPAVYASLVRGQAHPVFNEEACVLGQPISYGLGYAADAQLLNRGAMTPDGSFSQPVLAADVGEPVDRTASQSKSLTYLVSNGDGTFGLVTETRQTLAPVTLLKGTPNELTVEVLGEYVFRAVATGMPGGARVDYAPDGAMTPTTPVLRILKPGSPPTEVTFGQLFGSEGFTAPSNPVVALAVGENPRAIPAPGKGADPSSAPELAPDGTIAAGAVDVVRLTLLDPAQAGSPQALDVRIGHMEARAAVPAGGIRCQIPMGKAATPEVVVAGEPFTWTISIPRTPDSMPGLACDLVDVSVVDTSSAEAGVEYVLESASNGGVIDGGKVSWSNLGNYHPGDPPIVVTVDGRLAPTSAAGVLSGTADVTAGLGGCTGGSAGNQLAGLAKVDTAAVLGTTSIAGPRSASSATAAGAAMLSESPPELPKTGDDSRRRALTVLALLAPGVLFAGRRLAPTRRT